MLARNDEMIEDAFREAGISDDPPAGPPADDIPPVSSFEEFGDFRGDSDLEQALELEQEGAQESDCLDEWDAGEDTEDPPPREWLLGNQFCRKFVSGLKHQAQPENPPPD
jgi:hypothetical protein